MEDDEVIDLQNSSEDEADINDIDLSAESVSFKDKVEKWLVTCNEAQANGRFQDSETVFQKKTVVVSEVVDEQVDKTESMHSVDTEQYIKSNRRKTTTKITTTTIKKYYSMVKVDKTSGNNNVTEGGRQPRLRIRDVITNREENDSGNGNRKSPRKAINNKSNSLHEEQNVKTNRKTRNQSPSECNTDQPIIVDQYTQVPSTAKKNDKGEFRSPYNTRLNDGVQIKNRYSADILEAMIPKKMPKRAKITKKRNHVPARGSQMKHKPLNDRTDSIRHSTSVKPTRRNTSKSKLKTGALQSEVNYRRTSSDSEEDDILLTSYKPFSRFP